MIKVEILKRVKIPNYIKIERYRRVPEFGPSILFFSGGTALKRVSKNLTKYTHNSIHVITSFDSGGSSATLRDAFDMLSVGDLRSRLIALADQSVKGNREIYKLFSYRFPKGDSVDNLKLLEILKNMGKGKGELIEQIEGPIAKIISNHINYFIKNIPNNFDLRGASIGNLILAGGYLNNGKDIEPVLYIFSNLVKVLGKVIPITKKSLHIGAKLSNGDQIIGQHNLTGKERPPLEDKIEEIFISSSKDSYKKGKFYCSDIVKEGILKADIICYPIGSFYTSVIANLLAEDISDVIKLSFATKIYIPNTYKDPEQIGLSLSKSIEIIVSYIKKGRDIPIDRLLQFVIIDSKNGDYSIELDIENVKNMGVKVIDIELITEGSYPYIDPEKISEVILSLT